MKAKLLKKFRAKYQIKWVEKWNSKFVSNSGIIHNNVSYEVASRIGGSFQGVLERTDYFVVDKNTGYVFMRHYCSIGDAIRAFAWKVIPFYYDLINVKRRSRIIEQNKLKRLVERGKY